MAIVINSVSERYFELNGVRHPKIYTPLKQGLNDISLINAFDSNQKPLNSTRFDEFIVNGQEYNNTDDLIDALLPTVYLEKVITSIVNEYITNYNNEITNIYNNDVINAPDEEDLTEVGNELKLKDRNKTIDNTQGYRIIRDDFDFDDIPTNYKNSIWEIRQNFNLSGSDIVLPDGVTLYINGGSFTNYSSIDGNGANIIDVKTHIFKGNGSVKGFDVDFYRGEWFGTRVDEPTFDNSVPITRAFECALESTKCSKIKLPVGQLYIQNPIILLKPSAFYNLEIEGAIMPYRNPGGGDGYGGVTVIRNTVELPFALVIQGARGVTIRNIVFHGDLTEDFDEYDLITKPTSELIPNTSRYAPECAIVIDPFVDEIPPDGGYNGYTSYYNSDAAFSSKILIEKCSIQHYKNGIAVSPNSKSTQADSITIDDVEFNNGVNGIIVCQAQSRRVSCINCDMKRLKFCFNTAQYGDQQGVMPEVVNLKIADACAWVFNHSGNTSFAHFVNVYAEALYGIGYSIINKYPMSLVNCTIKLTPYTDSTKKYPNPCILKTTMFSLINTSITIGGGGSHQEPLIMDVDNLTYLNAYLDANIINLGASYNEVAINKTVDYQSQYRKEDVTWKQSNINGSSDEIVSYNTGTELYSFIPHSGSETYTTDDFVFGKVELNKEPFIGGGADDIYTVFGKVESVDGGTNRTYFKSNLLPTDGNDFPQRIAWKSSSSESGAPPVIKKIDIGNWNMNNNETQSVAHNLSATEWATVTSVEITIINDEGDVLYPLGDTYSGTSQTQGHYIDSNNFNLIRESSGFFNTVDFNESGGYNRGYITFTYSPD